MSTTCSARPKRSDLNARAVLGSNGSRGHAHGGWLIVKLLVTLLAFALTGIAGAEPNDKLPDFGTPADMALSKSREAQLGRGVMLQLRNAGAVVDDPQLTEYIGSLGGQIASHANNGDFKFHFFFVKEDEINAFALPGGYRRRELRPAARDEQRERARRSARARGLARDAAAHRTRDVRQRAHEHRLDGRDARRGPARRGGPRRGRRPAPA